MAPLDDPKAARLYFNRLMESLPHPVYFKDREGRFLYINQAQARFLGVKEPSDALGKNDYDFFKPEQAKIKDADEREIVRTGVGFVDKEELSTGIGQADRWCHTSKLPLFGDKGEIIGTFGISRDISEMKQTRAELDAHHRLVSTLIEILPCRIFVKDCEGRIKLTNRAYRGALGIEGESEIVGRRLTEIVQGERSRRYAEDDDAVIAKGVSILNREDFDASPLGDKRWLLLSKVPLRDASGAVEGMVGMAADITAQKDAEERALEAQHALEEKNAEIEAELDLARELQTELMSSTMQNVREELDPRAPFVPKIAFHYEPSAHLAGDFFQFIPISEHTFGLIMCDVMGHGVKAALVTTLIRGLLANLRADELSPAEVLAQLNERLCKLLDRPPLPRFVTAIYAVFDIQAGRMRVASAGHPWPLRQPVRGHVAPVSDAQCGPALGLIRGAAYSDIRLGLEQGDRLLLFTDGWTEERDSRGEEYGRERMAAALAGSRDRPPEAVLKDLAAALRKHAQTGTCSDDLCAILACF